MFEVSTTALDPVALRAMLAQSDAGALVVFEGWVRDHNEGQTVTSLFYEAAADLCRAEAEKIVAEARAKFGVLGVRCAHRVGKLKVGELAVWVGVTAGHRDAAFAACRYVIDELKTRLPIWKKEFYNDAHARWIGA
jgi:molybdopterin synthase catalytic subunit